MSGPYNRHRYDPDPDDSPAPCKTCGGTATVRRTDGRTERRDVDPCPDCTDDKENT